MSITRNKNFIKDSRIIAILRGDFSLDDTLKIAETLLSNGVNVFEITLNSPIALRALPVLQKEFGDRALIGAGTVRNSTHWTHAMNAGASFTVAPNFSKDVIQRAVENDVLHLPGVLTPSNIVDAIELGCVMQKLFPAEAMGGVSYLKAVQAPIDDVELVAVGGINQRNMESYLQAGAVAVGLGSSLIPSSNWTVEQIAMNCKSVTQFVHKFKLNEMRDDAISQ